MNSSMMKRRLLCSGKLGVDGNIHNFDEYTSDLCIVSPSTTLMSNWLEVDLYELEYWLTLQNVPTMADFFVVALRVDSTHQIYFNHHIEESFEFIFSLDKETFKQWLEESFLQKLVRGGLITSADVVTLIDKVK